MRRNIWIGLLVGVLLIGCQSKKEPDAPAVEQVQVPKSSGLSNSTLGYVQQALVGYEGIRMNLANDAAEQVTQVAQEMIYALEKIVAEKPASIDAQVNQTLGAVRAFVDVDTQDIEAVRKSYGDISKHMVSIIQEIPELQSKLHIFQCPMVKDAYNQWLQFKPEIDNPYMGKSMPECGGPGKWDKG